MIEIRRSEADLAFGGRRRSEVARTVAAYLTRIHPYKACLLSRISERL